VQADATVKAADIEAQSRVEAAQIYGRAYAGSRSCTTCCARWTPWALSSRRAPSLILRTDAAPFRVLVDGPKDVAAMSQA
jgi:membrane protease subunit HflC